MPKDHYVHYSHSFFQTPVSCYCRYPSFYEKKVKLEIYVLWANLFNYYFRKIHTHKIQNFYPQKKIEHHGKESVNTAHILETKLTKRKCNVFIEAWASSSERICNAINQTCQLSRIFRVPWIANLPYWIFFSYLDVSLMFLGKSEVIFPLFGVKQAQWWHV